MDQQTKFKYNWQAICIGESQMIMSSSANPFFPGSIKVDDIMYHQLHAELSNLIQINPQQGVFLENQLRTYNFQIQFRKTIKKCIVH